MALSVDMDVGFMCLELFQLDRISNSKLSGYKYPCKYCSISVSQTASSHPSASCCCPLLVRRQASFVQVLSFSSIILILNRSIPVSSCQFQNEFISYKEEIYRKKPSLLLLQQQMFLVLITTELLMWLLVNSWLSY